MKSYSSCFIGIPLPQEYQQEFEQLLIDINAIDPSIEIVQPQTPHITLSYLNKQSQFALNKISKLIKPYGHLLQDVDITVSGLGYFSKENPQVIFLDIKYPELLADFRNKILPTLEEFSVTDNTVAFHPHLTVGRIKDTKARENFRKNEKIIAQRVNKVNWNFKVREIALYGVDSTKSPEHQEKLFSIPVIL